MMIDDAVSILHMLKESLESEDYEVETVNNSTKGLDMIKTDA